MPKGPSRKAPAPMASGSIGQRNLRDVRRVTPTFSLLFGEGLQLTITVSCICEFSRELVLLGYNVWPAGAVTIPKSPRSPRCV